MQAGVYAWICVWTKMCVCLFGGNERQISIAFTLNNGANQSLGSSLIKRWARCTRVHSRELMEDYNQMQTYKDSTLSSIVFTKTDWVNPLWKNSPEQWRTRSHFQKQSKCSILISLKGKSWITTGSVKSCHPHYPLWNEKRERVSSRLMS